MSSDHESWPNGARLAVTVSMQFEAGGQPLSGAGGPITEPIMEGYPGLGQNSFYEYGAREEVPPADYEQQLVDGFDQLYAEGATRCRISGPQERSRSGPSTTPTPPPGRPGAGSGQRAPGAQPVTRRVVRDLPLDRPPPPGQVSDTR
jgi:hypothetical protein